MGCAGQSSGDRWAGLRSTQRTAQPLAAAEVRALASELGAQLGAIYGSRLHALILYGSYARGQARSGSDVDVAVVLESFERAWPEIDRTGPLVSRLSLKYGTTVSLVPIRRVDWVLQRTRLARSLAREGLPLR